MVQQREPCAESLTGWSESSFSYLLIMWPLVSHVSEQLQERAGNNQSYLLHRVTVKCNINVRGCYFLHIQMELCSPISRSLILVRRVFPFVPIAGATLRSPPRFHQ